MRTRRVDGGPSLAPRTTEGVVVAWFGGESVASSSAAAADHRGDGTGGGGGRSSSRKRRRRRAGDGGGGGVTARASAAACYGIHLTGAAGGPAVVGVAAGTDGEEPDAGLLLTAVCRAARALALACEAFAVLAALCDHARNERDGGGGACATAAAVVREMVGSVAVPLLDALGDDTRAWTREGGDDDAAHARHTAARRVAAGCFRAGAAATALLGASSAALARAGATRERWRDAAWDVLDRLPPTSRGPSDPRRGRTSARCPPRAEAARAVAGHVAAENLVRHGEAGRSGGTSAAVVAVERAARRRRPPRTRPAHGRPVRSRAPTLQPLLRDGAGQGISRCFVRVADHHGAAARRQRRFIMVASRSLKINRNI